MNKQRHKRAESFSVLVISNLDRSNRQFNVTLLSLRLAAFALVLICTALGVFVCLYVSARGTQADLHTQLTAQEQLVRDLETERDALNEEKLSLAAENETLRQNAEPVSTKESAESVPVTDPSFPSRYPSYGAGVLQSSFSADRDYLSINTYAGGNIIAAGKGTVTDITSDDTYPHIIEVDHGNGYLTRYLCRQEAELRVVKGAQIQAGDILLTITKDDTQFDYQVIFNGEPINPLDVIDAKG